MFQTARQAGPVPAPRGASGGHGSALCVSPQPATTARTSTSVTAAGPLRSPPPSGAFAPQRRPGADEAGDREQEESADVAQPRRPVVVPAWVAALPLAERVEESRGVVDVDRRHSREHAGHGLQVVQRRRGRRRREAPLGDRDITELLQDRGSPISRNDTAEREDELGRRARSEAASWRDRGVRATAEMNSPKAMAATPVIAPTTISSPTGRPRRTALSGPPCRSRASSPAPAACAHVDDAEYDRLRRDVGRDRDSGRAFAPEDGHLLRDLADGVRQAEPCHAEDHDQQDETRLGEEPKLRRAPSFRARRSGALRGAAAPGPAPVGRAASGCAGRATVSAA